MVDRRAVRTPPFFHYSLFSGQYRIILSADTASEVRQLLSQKRLVITIDDTLHDTTGGTIV